MGILYDLVDPSELVGFARTYADEVLNNRFTGNQYLPNRYVDDIEYALKRLGLTDVDIAKYRSWDTQPPMTGRPGISRVRGEIAPVSRQIALGEEEGLRLRGLGQKVNNPLIDAIFDDVERMIRSVEGRIEVARFDTLIDGVCTLHENGLELEADYGMPADHKVVTPVAWTIGNKATALPITDMLIAQAAVEAQGGSIGKFVMSKQRLPALLVNDEVLAYAGSISNLTPIRLRLADVQGVLEDQGLPPIEFYDVQIRDNGMQRRVLPPEYVLCLPSDPFGVTLYGPTAEAVLLAEKGYIKAKKAPGLVAVVSQNETPVQTFTLGTGVALPVVPNPELMYTMKVDAGTNSGAIVQTF